MKRSTQQVVQFEESDGPLSLKSFYDLMRTMGTPEMTMIFEVRNAWENVPLKLDAITVNGNNIRFQLTYWED